MPLRLACFGLVQETAGSVATANYLVLRELLTRGVEVDFYAERQYVPEPRGLLSGNFEYLGFERPRWIRALPPRGRFIVNWLLTPLGRRSWARIFGPVALQRHRTAPYDALLALGTPPPFAIGGVPTITWLQGPRHTEVEALRRLRDQVVSYESRTYYYAVRAYYAPRRWLDCDLLTSSDVLICGSQWAREHVAKTERGTRLVTALPYPVDLERFRPTEQLSVDWSRLHLVWLGRMVPRKRLDLLLDAFALVVRKFPDARLTIVGTPGYAPGQLTLMEKSPVREQIEYLPRLSRDEVVGLLRSAAVVIQTSENENFGSAIAEAQACGVPVVLGPTNGTKDYIDAVSSRVFARYSPESVAGAVVDTLNAYRLRPEVTRTGARASAERWFAPAGVVDALLDVITPFVDRYQPHLAGVG